MEFFESNFVELAVIFGLFLISKFFLAYLVRRIVRLVDDGDDTKRSMREKRAETLGKTLVTTGNVVLDLERNLSLKILSPDYLF